MHTHRLHNSSRYRDLMSCRTQQQKGQWTFVMFNPFVIPDKRLKPKLEDQLFCYNMKSRIKVLCGSLCVNTWHYSLCWKSIRRVDGAAGLSTSVRANDAYIHHGTSPYLPTNNGKWRDCDPQKMSNLPGGDSFWVGMNTFIYIYII